MKPQNIQKNTWLVLTVLLLLIILSNLEYHEPASNNSLIRIHVLANSNSEADQTLKLQVKDAVIDCLEPLLKNSSTLEESRQIICASLPQLEAAAVQTIRQHGYSYDVSLQYGRFDFPEKYCDSFSLPAGNYEALRILIGSGQGRNWWCVLFPPLCFTDSNVSESNEIPNHHIQIKFKTVEWLQEHLNDDTQKTKTASRQNAERLCNF